MMMFWIVFLLVGSINCSPIPKDYGSEATSSVTSFMPQPVPLDLLQWGRRMSYDTDSSSSLPSLPYPSSGQTTKISAPQDAISSAGPGSYSSSQDLYSSSTNMAGNEFDSSYASFGDQRFNSPEAGEYGVVYAASHSSGYDGTAPSGSYSGGYGSSAGGYVGSSSYEFVTTPQDEDQSSGSAINYGAGDENPEPVFSDLSDLEPIYSFSSRSSYQRGRAVYAQTRYTPGEPVPPLMPVSRRISKNSKQSTSADTPTKGGF